MPNEAQALPRSSTPDDHDDAEYRAFHAALSESLRGRNFLAEYAKRNRNADTAVIIEALDRLETLVRSDAATLNRQREELRMLLIAVRMRRPQTEIGPAADPTELAKLIDLLERRIEAMVEANAAPAVEARAIATPEDTRPALAVVPPLDEPELPIPSPVSAPPAMALVAEPKQPAQHLDLDWANAVIRAARRDREPDMASSGSQIAAAPIWQPLFGGQNVQDDVPGDAPDRAPNDETGSAAAAIAIMPEVDFIGSGPAEASAPAAVAPATMPAAADEAAATAGKPAVTYEGPLAAILSLSEEERIALFT
jgi:hypothetical protein